MSPSPARMALANRGTQRYFGMAHHNSLSQPQKAAGGRGQGQSSALPTPVEYETAGVFDQSGAFLSGASRVLLNLGAVYRRPLLEDEVFHTGFNAAYMQRAAAVCADG